MEKLQVKFPNFLHAMLLFKGDTDLELILNSEGVIKYRMTLIAFNNQIGNLEIVLNKFVSNESELVMVSFITIRGGKAIANTFSKFIKNDITVEEWLELLTELMLQHNNNPDHQKNTMDFLNSKLKSNNNTGCITILIGFTFVVFMILNFIIIENYKLWKN